MAFPPYRSPNTALALVLPSAHLSLIQPLRSLYDAAAIKWPPHINLFYPFVHPTALSAACDHISRHLDSICKVPIAIRFSSVEVFRGGKKRPSYLVLRPDRQSEEYLQDLYELLSREFPDVREAVQRKEFKPHLTIGQIHTGGEARVMRLAQKFEMLCPLLGEVQVGLAVMERIDRKMKFVDSWGVQEYPVALSPECVPGSVVQRGTWTLRKPLQREEDEEDEEESSWECIKDGTGAERVPVSNFTLSTFNVFVDIDDPQDQDSRWEKICAKLASLDSTIVCLQEVSDDLLAIIGATPGLQRKYPYISHSPEQPLLRHRNCLTLSSVPFSWEEVTTSVQGRSICVAKFDQYGYYTTTAPPAEEGQDLGAGEGSTDKTWHPLVVCNVHLPAYLTNEAIEARRGYVSEIKAHLDKHYRQNPTMIVGDTNIADSATIDDAVARDVITQASCEEYAKLFPSSEYFDAWLIAGEGLDGNTFDPASNPLALKNVQSNSGSLQPQRYDRMYLRKAGGENLLIREVRVDADREGEALSDHYMLAARFSFTDISNRPALEQSLPLPETSITDDDVRAILLANDCFPSAEDTASRRRALHALNVCLQGPDDAPFPLRLVPVGSFGLGTYDATSDMDILAVGAISSSLFWRVAKHRIKRYPPNASPAPDNPSVRIVRFVDAAIPMLILLVGNVRVDLQYCTAVRLLDEWDAIPTTPANGTLFALPVPTLKKLQAYRDMLHILNHVPNLAAFRLAYRYIKLWASNKGLYNAKFGYLGGVHITLLLARISMLLPPVETTASQLIVAFFQEYAAWDWAASSVVSPGRTTRYQRAGRDKMVVLAIHAPATNVAANATVHTVRTLQAEMQTATARLELGGTLADVAGEFGDAAGQLTGGVGGFLTGYARYARVDVQFWGTNRQNGRALVGWVESRLVGLLVEMGRQTPGLEARVWPGRFHEVLPAAEAVEVTESQTGNGEEDRSELRGFYLIGLAPAPSSSDMTKDAKRAAEAAFAAVLRNFETAVRANYKFDAQDGWVSVSCVKVTELAPDGGVVAEDKTMVWDGGEADDGKSMPDDSSSDDDNSDDEEGEVNALIPRDDGGSDGSDDFFAGMKKTNKKAAARALKAQQQKVSGATPKLRPAHEVLHRMKWDPRYDAASYLVGYEDRFRGVLEIAVDRWRTDMSEDEFVPMHRIVYFKARATGEVVWDREKRVDKVFGSGRREEQADSGKKKKN